MSMERSKYSRRSFLATLAAGLAVCPAAFAQASEYKLKAAFIYNFIKFVEWPPLAFANNTSPLILGIVGRDPFQGELEEAVRDKIVGGRTVRVTRFALGDDLASCHVVFLPKDTDRRKLTLILSQTKALPLLTVGDELPGFAQGGGVINLFREEDKIRFEINVDSARIPAAAVQWKVTMPLQLKQSSTRRRCLRIV